MLETKKDRRKIRETLAELQLLDKKGIISDFYFDKDILKEDRENSIWYCGTLVSYTLKYGEKEFHIRFAACGEVRVELIKSKADYNASQNGNLPSSQYFRSEVNSAKDFLEENGIYCDTDFFNIGEGEIPKSYAKPSIIWYYGNWFELQIGEIVVNYENLLTEGCDTSDFDEIAYLNIKDTKSLIDELLNN